MAVSPVIGRMPAQPLARRSPRRAWLLGLLVLHTGLALTAAGGEALTPQQIKAGLVFNFAKFVEFPADRFAKPADPIIFAVVGSPEIEEILKTALKDRLIGGRSLLLRHIETAEEARGVHVVFFAGDARPALLEELREASILTVGDSSRFLDLGGVIQLREVQGKSAFAINMKLAVKKRLHVSSKLQSLAVEIIR